jgi:hypothetical protein
VLAQLLVLLTAVAVFAAAGVAGIASVARARTAERAEAALAPALETALGAYERAIGATIAAQATTPGTAAPPPPLDALNGGTAFPAQRYVEAVDGVGPPVVVTITPTASSVPACAPAGPGVNAGPDLEIDGQCSPFVGESRLSLELVADAGVAHRRTLVTLRLFAQPPYAMPAGAKDGVPAGDAHEGDVDGYGNAVGAFAPPAPLAGDTTIHVVYACTPALGDCSQSRPPPVDAPTSLPWSNGNAASP